MLARWALHCRRDAEMPPESPRRGVGAPQFPVVSGQRAGVVTLTASEAVRLSHCCLVNQACGPGTGSEWRIADFAIQSDNSARPNSADGNSKARIGGSGCGYPTALRVAAACQYTLWSTHDQHTVYSCVPSLAVGIRICRMPGVLQNPAAVSL